MSRTSTKSSREVAKRAPRRQVPRKRTVSKIRRAPVNDKEEVIRLSPEIVEKVEKRIESSQSTVERKAPANFKAAQKTFKLSRRVVVTITTIVIGFIATVWIGFSDQGQIDVSARIIEKNAEIMSGIEGEENIAAAKSQIVPVQNTASTNIPNGGLRGRGVGTSKVSQSEIPIATSTATSTASSTLDVATSTEELSDVLNEEVDDVGVSDISDSGNESSEPELVEDNGL
ncbi:MAG: hypothetical protein R3B60_02115 [Candidatus Paceibacterota bacterium]